MWSKKIFQHIWDDNLLVLQGDVQGSLAAGVRGKWSVKTFSYSGTGNFHIRNQKDDQDLADGKDFPLYDTNIQGEEDLYLRMPVVQELKVLFLNMGGILQDIIKETYETYFHYVHIYYIPI